MSSSPSTRVAARAIQTASHPPRRLPAAAAVIPAVALAATLCAPAAGGAAPAAGGAALGGGASAVGIEPRRAALVTLAEVASQVDPGATRLSNLTELLRRDVEAELAAIDWAKESVRRRYKLSASVVNLETARADGVLRVSCTVSAAVRDDRGVLLAIVQGRARTEGAGVADGIAASAEQGALAGAVHGAITAVPEAIRRAQ